MKWCNSHTSHYVHQFYTDYSVFYFYVVLLPPKKTGWWTANKCPPIYWVICLRCMLRMTRILIPSVISLKKKIKVPALSNQLFFYDSYKHYCGKKIVRYLYEEYRHIISILEYICLDKYTYFCTFSYAVNLKF